jgi:excisionase family DNA binding protein
MTAGPQAPHDWRGRTTITVEEAGTILGIGRSSAYELVRSGEIPMIRLGRRFVVPVAPLRRMLGEAPSDDNDAAGNGAEVTAPAAGTRGHVHPE